MQYQHKATGRKVLAIQASEMDCRLPPEWLTNACDVTLHYESGCIINYIEVNDFNSENSAWREEYIVLSSYKKIKTIRIMSDEYFKANYQKTAP